MHITVVMVDDETLVLDSLERILSSEEDISVIGRAATGAEAIQKVRTLRPDVVLMDLLLKGDMDGVEATRQIRNGLNPPAVLAVTSFDTDPYMRGALEAGASGFLLKNDATSALAEAIRMTYEGDPMISPVLTSRLIASYIAPQTDPLCEAARARVKELSPREIEVAQLVGSGNTYDEIAKKLFISASTVKSTIRRAMNKTGADSGAQLAVLVAQARLDQVDT
ncbi:response regulator transcription factor [Nesterenkonia sp. MY13]|uniref:Response regulator transcription factor n=1 Tax=Nesterenkonia sedimenti TaxID=1463632 RepID=A0A7X8TJE8_9MICC|nr:response regulator transcription factor [Nesterenkonia sedimenti]NLS09876.1 response regulator transcription factor [Nesterenkonia sedimenti]